MHFLPWWALVACLAASALAAYLFLGRTRAGDSPWALFPLTVALAPVILAGAAVAALVLSTLLSALLEDRMAAPAGPPEPAARTERTGAEGTDLETTSERTARATGSPSASLGASPPASASASASP